MAHYCKYHPLELASWHCPRCLINNCETCSPERPGEEKGTPHFCPVCNGEMNALGAAHAAPPFWQMLGHFLQYAFSPIGVALMMLAFIVPVLAPAGMVAVVAQLVVLGVVMKYAYTALEYMGSGKVDAISPQELSVANNNDLMLKLTLLLGAVGVAIGYVATKSLVNAYALGIVATLMVPAMIMAATIDKNIASAVSGESLKLVLSTLHVQYGVFALMLLLLLGGLQSFVAIFADILPINWATGLSTAVYSYFLISLCVATGYLLFQFQSELGYSPAYGDKRAKHKKPKIVDAVSNQVELYLKEGMYAKALAILKSETSKKSVTLGSHERYHKLLVALNEEEALAQHINVYFKALIEAGRGLQVLGVMKEQLAKNSKFKPDDPDVCLSLAETFIDMEEYKIAAHLLSGMHQESPQYTRLPDAYLLAAKLFNEHMNMPQKAMAFIQFLDGRYKNHPRYPDIAEYMRQIKLPEKV